MIDGLNPSWQLIQRLLAYDPDNRLRQQFRMGDSRAYVSTRYVLWTLMAVFSWLSVFRLYVQLTYPGHQVQNYSYAWLSDFYMILGDSYVYI